MRLQFFVPLMMFLFSCLRSAGIPNCHPINKLVFHNYAGECPNGLQCCSISQEHFRRYSHSAQAISRSKVSLSVVCQHNCTHTFYLKLLIRNSTLRSPKIKKLQEWQNITYFDRGNLNIFLLYFFIVSCLYHIKPGSHIQ